MKKYLLFSLSIASFGSVWAQPEPKRGFENSSQEVISGTNIRLLPSSKLLIDPIVSVSKNPEIKLNLETPDYFYPTPKLTPSVDPQPLKEPGADSTYKSNYLRLGAGNLGHVLGELYIASEANKDYAYSLNVGHLQGNNPNSFQDFQTTQVAIQGSKFYYRGSLTGGFQYQRDALHYFAADSAYTGDAVMLGKVGETMSGSLDYQLKRSGKVPELRWLTQYQAYSNNLNQKESELSSALNLKQDLGTQAQFIADVAVTKLMFEQAPNLEKPSGLSRSNQLFVDARPQIAIQHRPSQLNLSCGVTMTMLNAIEQQLQGDTSIQTFRINPYVEFHKKLSGMNMQMFGVVDGGLKKNSIRRMQAFVPFAYDSIGIQNTYEQINAHAGVRGRISDNSNFELSFGGNSVADMPLIVSNLDRSNAMADSLNSLQVVYDNVNSMYFRFQTSLSMGEKFLFHASTRIVNYSPAVEQQAWHLPSFTFQGFVRYKAMDQLYVQTSIAGMGKRFNRALDENGALRTMEIPGFMDLQLRADYSLPGKGRVWVQGSNLLQSGLEQFAGYRGYGLNIMGGIAISLF